MTNQKPPESHYDPEKLHKIFAIVALILLSALGLLFLKDYSREWKVYQQEFRTLEIEQTRMKHDAETVALDKNADYQTLKEELALARKEYQSKCATLTDLQKEIKNINTLADQQKQELKFVRAELDAARYRYEEAAAHNHHVEETKKEYDDYNQRTQKLAKDVEVSDQKLKEKSAVLNTCGEKLKELEKKDRQLTKGAALFERKLKKIDPNEMKMMNRVGQIIRDLPIIEMSNPNYKVEQIVLKDITEDMNFKQVPRVDRCTTCHLGIANPDYKNMSQPYKSHPNLELYVGLNSPHPIEEFGCTVCHGGKGRATGFQSAVHTPSNEEEKRKWEEKYHWHADHWWADPMLPTEHTQAGCFKCHSGQTVIKGAEKLNLGLNLIERAGCYNCHTVAKYQGWLKSGPDLNKLASKVSKDWAYKWIQDPKSFRHNTWMPNYFNQANNNDPESIKRNQQEIHAMVAFLFNKSEKFKLDPLPVPGDVKRGEELVASVGCMACHQVQPEKSEKKRTRFSLGQEHGPNLIGLASKTSQEWLYSWLKNPDRYHPQTKMPNLRLTDQEAADISAYLSEGKNDTFDQKAVPPVDEKMVDEITLDFLNKASSRSEAAAKLASMKLEDKLNFTGEKLVSHYGCYSCHNIKGFENAKPIGVELTEEGQKSAHKLDFGFVHIDHTREAWFKQKVMDPRIFDKGKIKGHYEKLIMPNFNLTNEEADAVVTALLGFVRDTTVVNKTPKKTPERLYVEEGQKLIRQLNCQGCHIIEGEGGSVQQAVKDWLVKYDNRTESEANGLITSFAPPNLIGEGKKVQAKWLFEFIHSPTPIRPWLKIRMPTYTMNASHLNALVKYFVALDKEDFPFEEQTDVSLTAEDMAAAEKLFSTDYFGCAQCHIVGDKMPTGSVDSWAPNFALAKTRLKPNWVSVWLKNPAAMLPGTKMPTYFDPNSFDASGPEDVLGGDENAQIRVLRNYLYQISSETPAQPKKQEEAPKETPKEAPKAAPAAK